MDIQRTVNGENFSFKLSEDELRNAFYEYKEINYFIETICKYGDILRIDKIKKKIEIEVNKNMKEHKMTPINARKNAIFTVLRRYNIVV